ncbi:MAG: DEAD/DEAH box helicase family protein [Terrisporobacter sp.]
MSNFYFLDRWPNLKKLGMQAEQYILTDPNATMLKTRMLGEQLIDIVLIALKIEMDKFASQDDKIKKLRTVNINQSIPDWFNIVRLHGNKAMHEAMDDKEKAKEALIAMCKISGWFYINATKDKSILPLKFKMPKAQTKKVYNMEDYKKEVEKIEVENKKEIEIVKEELKQTSIIKSYPELKKVEDMLELNEAQTRKKLIDVLLGEANWNVSSSKVVEEYKIENYNGENGKVGYADYVLLDKKDKPIAVVEAKKTMVDPYVGQEQAKSYADGIEAMTGVRPIIYFTNGYETYMWDDKYSTPRIVWGFYTVEDLEYEMFKHKNKRPLSTVEIDTNISGRSYQIEGIKSVYEKFEQGYRKSLIVMATGCGKTRTAISLVKGMIEGNHVKRVLFLADRDELVKQASRDKSSFKTFMQNTPQMRVTSKTSHDRESVLYFSTYQTMINYYNEFSVGFFDLIICDEAHRSIYKVYKDIVNYFDAYIVGLTATPVGFINRNTFTLFDCGDKDPTFSYSYEEAINHKPQYLLKYKAKDASTDFLRKGIKWNNLSEEQKRDLEEDGLDEEKIDFDKNALEEFVTNKDTNRKILRNLMENGIKVKDEIGKSIIFAKNKNHATLLLKLFDEMYPQYNGSLAAIIHSDIKNKDDVLKNFKEEDRPKIAISVDMLDTGVDVPEVVNLVFAKPIYSKVKFLQMIGRGTRLCPNLFGDGEDKEEFYIFDHWQNFEFFEEKPEGIIPRENKSSQQIRFENRINLLEILSTKGLNKEATNIIKLIREDIDSLPEKSVEIRKNKKLIDSLKLDKPWQNINTDLLDILRKNIAPLMLWIDIHDQRDAMLFDNTIYKIEICKLKEDPKEITYISKVIGELARLNTSMNQFNGTRELVKELLEIDKWSKLSYKELEDIRILLRDLMKYKSKNGPKSFVEIDIKDSDIVIKDIETSDNYGQVNVDAYIERVKTSLEKEMSMNLVIQKIRKGKEITKQELDMIYDIFNSGKVEFSIDELSEKAHVSKDDVIGIIRKFVGVDEEELNIKFEEFISDHNSKMNVKQMNMIRMIKDDIVKNKGISFASLYEGKYTTISKDGIDGVFNGKLCDEVFDLIEPYRADEDDIYA